MQKRALEQKKPFYPLIINEHILLLLIIIVMIVIMATKTYKWRENSVEEANLKNLKNITFLGKMDFHDNLVSQPRQHNKC